MRYAIIGSNSFSGSNLIDKLLTNGNTVLGISRSNEKSELYLPYKTNSKLSNFNFMIGDLNYPINVVKALDTFEPEYIVNYSALNEVFPSLEHFEDYYQTNVLATAKFLNAIKYKKYLKRYLHISTCEVYGNCKYLANEESRLNPTTPYAISKAAIDLHLLSMCRHFGFPAIITRSTSVFGACQQIFKVIPRTILTFLADKPMTVHGDGKIIRTWIHINDVSDGILKAIKVGKVGEIYNLSSSYRYTVTTTMLKIAHLMGLSGKLEYVAGERKGQDQAYQLDYSKAEQELDWSPKVTFEQGINATLGWVKANLDLILKESKDYVHKL